MKKSSLRYFWLLPVAAFFLLFASYTPDADKDMVMLDIMMRTLQNTHYTPADLNDEFSEKVYKLYMERLDFNKKFFTQDDIQQLKPFYHQIDNEVQKETFRFFELSFSLYNGRREEVEKMYKEILASPFDFTQEDSIELDEKKLTYPADKAGLKDTWRKYLKYQTMLRLSDMLDDQEKAKEKKDTTIKICAFTELEDSARRRVLKTQDEYFQRLGRMDRNDRLSLYLNCIANVFDPHTEFYPAKDKENFDIAISGKLEGIGAQLQEKDGYIKVTSIVPGSPSYRQGQLKAGDIILKVAQGKEEPVDVVGMRLDNAVRMIRGKKGTEVRLTVKKPEGTMVIIPIVRDVVVLEETYAKSAVIEYGGKKTGFVRLPTFYADFKTSGGRNCSSDVAVELDKLKKENVQGIVLDLRDNGGGSLQDVVKMMGLFIEKGPVVEIRSRTGSPQMLSDEDPTVSYSGPLVVMVNANSASASEIFAAAVQDYGRGVVVGGNTFGKGTVQRFYNLDDHLTPAYSSLKPLGSLKVTMQKFYRITGASTQLKGVTPDIILPDNYTYVETGEKEMDYPMAWDEISPAAFIRWNKSPAIDKIKSESSKRIAVSDAFRKEEQSAKKAEELRKSTGYTLQLDKYRIQDKKIKEFFKKTEPEEKENTQLNVYNISSDLAHIQSDSTLIGRNTEWFKSIRKDFYLLEALQVAGDIK